MRRVLYCAACGGDEFTVTHQIALQEGRDRNYLKTVDRVKKLKCVTCDKSYFIDFDDEICEEV